MCIRRRFANLKVHSVYSILESTLSLDKIAALAAAKAQPAVCLTDPNLHGALEFCIKCSAADIQPVIGCKLLIDCKQTQFSAAASLPPLLVTLLVKTEAGYANLLKLVNNSELSMSYHTVSLAALAGAAHGLIGLIGEVGGAA